MCPLALAPEDLFALSLNVRYAEVRRAKVIAEAVAVATGKRPPPDDWYGTAAAAKAGNQNFLDARLRQMMAQGVPRGGRR